MSNNKDVNPQEDEINSQARIGQLETLLKERTSELETQIKELDIFNKLNQIFSQKIKSINSILTKVAKIIQYFWDKNELVCIKIGLSKIKITSSNYLDCFWRIEERIILTDYRKKSYRHCSLSLKRISIGSLMKFLNTVKVAGQIWDCI